MPRSSRWLTTVVVAVCFGCEGPMGPSGEPGPAGPSGAEGDDGEDGESGQDGMSATGSDAGRMDGGSATTDSGVAGRDASTEAGAGARYDCKWCTPVPGNYPAQCTTDGKALQRCADDGDGCGHWVSATTCQYGCGYTQGTESDALGNRQLGAHQCRPSANCTTGGLVCPASQSCDAVSGACVAAKTWMTTTAKLVTAFDGLTHTFTGRTPGLSAGCSETKGSYWDTVVTRTCTLFIAMSSWSESSLGANYNGHPLGSVYVTASALTASGLQTVACSGTPLNASRFSSRTNTCSLTVSSADLQPGGHVTGTLKRVDYVTGQGEPADRSTLTIDSSFRLAIP